MGVDLRAREGSRDHDGIKAAALPRSNPIEAKLFDLVARQVTGNSDEETYV
jgi:hypothetical protein